MHAQNQETAIVSLQKNITHGLKELIGRGEIRGKSLNADFFNCVPWSIQRPDFHVLEK
jgi:hypothetical protein